MADGFSNPNGHVNELALTWICNTISTSIYNCEEYNLLELYCGNCNHTCALSKYVKHTVAVEINKELCDAARINLAINKIKNVTIVESDSEKFARKILKNKYYIIQDGNVEKRIEFNFVLVDPPRAGLDVTTLSLIVLYDYILYISCNPAESAIRDLATLLLTHDMIKFATFDHFAFTNHLESGFLIRKKHIK